MYHLLFPQYMRRKWAYLPLGVLAVQEVKGAENPLLDAKYCRDWIGRLHRRYRATCSYGGWFEDRSTLWRGHYMSADQAIHLGVDFTVPTGSRVYSPTEATVHEVWHDPETIGGWGGRIILKIRPRLFLVLAHFGNINVKEGDSIKVGKYLGKIGAAPVNGNWFPHLHAQVVRGSIRNIDGYGCFSPQDQRKYPDPFQLWPLPNLPSALS